MALPLILCLWTGQISAGITESEPNDTWPTSDAVQWETSTTAAVSVARISTLSDLDFYRVTIPACQIGVQTEGDRRLP
jgi:hypothetical protein